MTRVPGWADPENDFVSFIELYSKGAPSQQQLRISPSLT
jgi:hypothetical protein